MRHAEEIELVELAAGNLPAGRQTAVRDHLGQCPECNRRFDELRRTWQALGRWTVEPAGCDVGPAVAAALRADVRPRLTPRFGPWVPVAARAAASIALAVAVGYTAGRLSGPAPPGAAPTLGPAPSEQVAASALHLELLETVTPAGLAEAILGADPDSLGAGEIPG